MLLKTLKKIRFKLLRFVFPYGFYKEKNVFVSIWKWNRIKKFCDFQIYKFRTKRKWKKQGRIVQLFGFLANESIDDYLLVHKKEVKNLQKGESLVFERQLDCLVKDSKKYIVTVECL